jgi:L-malate glycosyltransferase
LKVLLLSDTYSEHTEKWALGLANAGIEIGLFSFNKASYEWHQHKNITVFYEPEHKINAEKSLTKLAYLKYVTVLKKIIRHFKPDILHAHYATSYGLVGALSNFHPYIISAWGTDVMKFPNKNFVAKSILAFNFKMADLLCATSATISESIRLVTEKPVTIIPFGINTTKFFPQKVQSIFDGDEFILGSIKPLETIYNIHILIDSFAKIHNDYPNARLLIVGEGTAEKKLRALCESHGVENKVKFTGRIPFDEINKYYNMIDVFVNISEYESFGVSVIEAMACGIPVVVSNVGGLKEIVRDESLGLRVEPGNIEETTLAIERLLKDKNLYNELSINGREHVSKYYNWDQNLSQMILSYKSLIAAQSL